MLQLSNWWWINTETSSLLTQSTAFRWEGTKRSVSPSSCVPDAVHRDFVQDESTRNTHRWVVQHFPLRTSGFSHLRHYQALFDCDFPFEVKFGAPVSPSLWTPVDRAALALGAHLSEAQSRAAPMCYRRDVPHHFRKTSTDSRG